MPCNSTSHITSQRASLQSAAEKYLIMCTNYMSVGRILFKGDYLLSNNRKSKAIFQDDGNFVVYTNERAVWASNTANTDALQVIMQGDGNLVIYTNQSPIWSSKTSGGNKDVLPFLRLNDEGVLVLTLGGGVIWKSK
uniref:Bulb-type lectin domain-containing protein n=1 Tax=Esox lucius TaxID=8010 RepID=A0A3P8ZZX7_ESOLU